MFVGKGARRRPYDITRIGSKRRGKGNFKVWVHHEAGAPSWLRTA
jgi:hypothetical protein